MEATTRANAPFPPGNGNSETTLHKAAASVHGAVDKVAGAADTAVRNAAPAIDRAAQIAHQAVNKVAGAAGPTADWLAEKGDSLQASRRKLADDASHYVSAHPWKSLGLALAAGFIVSRFIR
jgi:ElaB/YqjD/DUF883 family membrane-anchored ribosome-binding protein